MSWTKKTLCTGYIELNSKNPLEKFFISQQYTYTVWLNCMVFILLINIILIEKWTGIAYMDEGYACPLLKRE